MRDERRGQWAWCCFSSLLPCSAHLPHFLHSFLHFFFFLIQPTPLTSHILLLLCMQRGKKNKKNKKCRLHSNNPAGTARGGYSGCIKFITDQRDRFWTLLLRRNLCFYIHQVTCATPWLSATGGGGVPLGGDVISHLTAVFRRFGR